MINYKSDDLSNKLKEKNTHIYFYLKNTTFIEQSKK